jgi:hypothetical protein
MQIINLFALLGLQGLMATTLAQSILLGRQSEIEACPHDDFINALCCNDGGMNCESTNNKPQYLISEL